MMSEPVLYTSADRVATITLNRPDKLNAYTVEMGEAAYAAFARARDDDRVRAVILTGAGRGFCAGVDLDALKAQASGADAGGGPRLGEEAFLTKLPLELLTWPKPVIAALNGAAVGVGITMALPCDLRIAAAGAKIGFTFAKLGILPGLGSTHLLPRLVGRSRALDLVLTARVVLAEEAAEMGLLNRVVPGAALLDEARALAAQLAELDPAVLAAAKRALTYGESAGMEAAMRNEAKASAELREAREPKA
jgi:2-(1,2-epoxy-1,2-dihydrophenyl)acetyl-CoA isomerase